MFNISVGQKEKLQNYIHSQTFSLNLRENIDKNLKERLKLKLALLEVILKQGGRLRKKYFFP